MIVARIFGGLGNQMFQYAYGSYLAVRHNTELCLHFTPYAAGPPRPFLLDRWKIDARMADEPLRRLVPRRRGGRGWMNWLRGDRPLKQIRERPFGFKPRYIHVGDHVYLNGYWQSEHFFPGMKQHVRDAFQPAGALGDQTLAVARAMERVESAAVHVRRTDYLQASSHANFCSLDHYRTSVAELLARRAGVHLFIFSDDLAWCREHFQFPCPVTFVGHNNGETAHEDVWLMSQCRHHIIANSTFSWWGAWLRNDESGEIFVPPVWFADPRMDSSWIVPPSWRPVAEKQATRRAA